MMTSREQAKAFRWADERLCEAIDNQDRRTVYAMRTWVADKLTGRMLRDFLELADEALSEIQGVYRKRRSRNA